MGDKLRDRRKLNPSYENRIVGELAAIIKTTILCTIRRVLGLYSVERLERNELQAWRRSEKYVTSLERVTLAVLLMSSVSISFGEKVNFLSSL